MDRKSFPPWFGITSQLPQRRRSRKGEAMSSAHSPDPAALDRVAEAALVRFADGMTLRLGTGRAAEAFIHRLAERVRRGLRIRAVPTSRRSEELSQRLNIEIVPLESVTELDIAFDGADEVTPDLLLTKGKGGAHLRERVVAYESRQFVVLVTPDKLVEKLGTLTPIPIEVVPFAVPPVTRHLADLGGKPALRKKPDGFPYATDNLNWLLDTDFGPIPDPRALDGSVRKIPGIVDTGIFIDMASVVLVGEATHVR